ncbi:MAG: hypothetical protein HY744_18780 [Deltaproteobacteria bacterium]|nr:hypothetical protein [Deltaproteobacteria bacterium]
MTPEASRPEERFARLAAAIRREIERIGAVVLEAEQALVELAQRTPPLRELRGCGDIVHDFYTGVERIFQKIAPELNGGLPAGAAWHRELLENMTLDLPGIRPPLLARDTARQLDEFLRFRHLFRNVYGFELEWPKLRGLLGRMAPAWQAVQADTQHLLAFLDAAACPPA